MIRALALTLLALAVAAAARWHQMYERRRSARALALSRAELAAFEAREAARQRLGD